MPDHRLAPSLNNHPLTSAVLHDHSVKDTNTVKQRGGNLSLLKANQCFEIHFWGWRGGKEENHWSPPANCYCWADEGSQWEGSLKSCPHHCRQAQELLPLQAKTSQHFNPSGHHHHRFITVRVLSSNRTPTIALGNAKQAGRTAQHRLQRILT